MTEHKLHLIQQISVIDNPNELEAFLEKELEEIKARKGKKVKQVEKQSEQIDYKKLLAKPMRKTFDKEAIMREQGWTGKHDKEGMERLVKEMNIQEPIEELLAMLTK